MAAELQVLPFLPHHLNRDLIIEEGWLIQERPVQIQEHIAPGGMADTWPENYQPQYRAAMSVHYFWLIMAGEGILATPSISVGLGLGASFTGELQFAEPEIVTWIWEVLLRGEGSLSPDLANVGFRVDFTGELAQSESDLTVFPGWLMAGRGELQLTAALQTEAFEANFTGEGILGASLNVSMAVALRGELVALSADFGESIDTLEVALRGEGAILSVDLFSDDDDWMQSGPIGVLYDTLSISETLGGGNSAAFTMQGVNPDIGSEVNIELCGTTYFTGPIIKTSRHFVENKATGRTSVNCVGLDWHLTRKKITASYFNTSATTIALSIMSRTTGFDTTRVQRGLPTIEAISFEGVKISDALSRLADRIGGHWRVDYPNLFFIGISEASGEDPEPLTPLHTTMANFRFDKDLGQVTNRLRIRGASTTIVPAAPWNHPDYWSPDYSKISGVDRQKIYPAGSTMLYVAAIDIPRPDLLDANDQPYNPPRKVPPLPLFNPAGGKVLIDGQHELEYRAIGKQPINFRNWSNSLAVQAISAAGGNIDLGNRFIYGTYFVYTLTMSTAFGETTAVADSGMVTLSQQYIDGEYVPDKSFLIKIMALNDHRVNAINVYRRVSGSGVWGPNIRVGSVPQTGGSFLDSNEIPDPSVPDEFPLSNTGRHPDMPYILLRPPTNRRVLKVGSTVQVFTTVDDLASQAVIAGLLSTPTRVDDGIIEDDLEDGDLGHDQLIPVGRAHLAARSVIEITPTWSSRDPNTHPGRTIYIDVPHLQGVFKIQTVQIDNFVKAGYANSGLQFLPTYNATASSRRFTINDLLKMVRR